MFDTFGQTDCINCYQLLVLARIFWAQRLLLQGRDQAGKFRNRLVRVKSAPRAI